MKLVVSRDQLNQEVNIFVLFCFSALYMVVDLQIVIRRLNWEIRA